MTDKVVYVSNGSSVGDGLRVTRVSGEGSKFEILVDQKTERYSEVTLKKDVVDPVPVPAPPVIVDPVPVPPVVVDPPVDPIIPEVPTEPIPVEPIGNETATISITRRSVLQAAPEGLFFEVDVSGFDSTGPNAGEVYDDRFHELYYYWDFDDPYTFTAPQNLAEAHKNANVAYGPMASHTFRTSGNFTVSVLVVEPSSGKQATATLEVVVGNSEELFIGSRTIFVSPSSDWTNAPAGAVQATSFNSAIAGVKGDDTTPKRIMLNRGEVFSFSGSRFGRNRGEEWPSSQIVAGPGDGPNPTVSCTGGFTWWDEQNSGNDKDFVLQNIVFIGPWDSTSETGSTGLNLYSGFSNPPQMFLVDGCTMSGFAIGIFSASGTYANNDKNTKIINDTVITNWRKYGLYEARSRETAVTGCRLQQHVDAYNGGRQDGTHNEQGAYRSPNPSKTIWHSNDMFSRTGWFENVSSYHTIQPCFRWNTSVVAGAKLNMQANAFEGGFVVVQLSSESSDPGFAVNAVLEKNYILGSHMTRKVFECEFGGTTFRNNVLVMPAVDRIGGAFNPVFFVQLNRYGNDATNQSSPISVYNNTFVSLMAPGNFSGSENATSELTNSGGFSNVITENNVVHQPNLSSPVVGDGPLDLTGTLWNARDKGYISSIHTTLLTQYATPSGTVATFAPLTGSAATGLISYDDFTGTVRPLGNEDRGAIQVSS